MIWLITFQIGSPPFFSDPFPPPPPPPVRPPVFPVDDHAHFIPEFESDDFGPKSWKDRAMMVKEAFVHAYHGYEMYASPQDELLPLTNKSINNFNGWGVTMVDSLDTMYLMGLHDEFNRGLKLVEQIAFAEHNKPVPFFETTIRYLGGLLSAYGLSHDPILLKAADELGAAMMPVFNTTSGFPRFSVVPATSTATGSVWSGSGQGWLAEIASCMMEYKYLAKVTGKKEYYDAANTVMQNLYEADVSKYPDGLLPSLWNLQTGQPINDQITIGAMADSAYEYFLKQYLLTNKSEQASLDLYLRTMRGIMDHSMFLSPTRFFLYVTDISAKSGEPTRRFEHLSCFLPGLFALGVDQLPASAFIPYSETVNPDGTPSELERHQWAAVGLGIGCATIYSDMPTRLGADEVVIVSALDKERDRIKQERIAEAERAKEEARRKAEESRKKEEEARQEQGRDEDIGKRSPPYNPLPRPAVRPPIAPKFTVNQTEEDEKLKWGNVLRGWRDGSYDGNSNSWLDEETHIFGNMWRSKKKMNGPIPGLRDPPLPSASDTDFGRDYKSKNPVYVLRPETIESYFILWRTTGNEIWRERGWSAFKAIEAQLRTRSGYTVLKNVFQKQGSVRYGDSMPSFFLAETLKYLYLLFSDDDLIPLDKYVFNTEAHPFPVFEWTEEEKASFGIRY